MDTQSSSPQETLAEKEEKVTQKPEWYIFLIDIFKKLLEFNYSAYGTKKKF